MVASLTDSQGRRLLPDSRGLSFKMRRCTGRTSQASGEGARTLSVLQSALGASLGVILKSAPRLH